MSFGFEGERPKPLSVQLVEIPNSPLGLPYVLSETQHGRRTRLPEEIEFIIDGAERAGMTLSEEQAGYLGRRTPAQFRQHVTETVARIFRQGEAYFLWNINLTFLVEQVPVWLAQSLSIPIAEGVDFSGFYESTRYHLPAGLDGIVVRSGNGCGSSLLNATAERIYTDGMRMVEETYRMLSRSGVPSDVLVNLLPQGVTTCAMWSVSLGDLRTLSAAMPDYMYEAIREELREFNPVYESLMSPDRIS